MPLSRSEKLERMLLLEERVKRVERWQIEHDREDILARCSTLAGFVREAWHVLEPTTPYVHSWHIDAMCAHLEAITDGRINRLLINVPPGSSKSLIVSVLWPAWEWGPCALTSMRYLTTSYTEESVKRDTRKHRDLTASGWYKALWPHVVLNRTAELSFANTNTGNREGVPFKSITGKRGDRLIIDDPHSVDGAESDADRDRAVRLFREGAINRMNDQQRSATVVVMQRLHERDISGTILKLKMGYEHVCLPMEFDPALACSTSIGFEDPRTTDGELLDPVRFPRLVVDNLKRDMGQYAYAGQYQQRPAPREGGLFKPRMIEPVTAAPARLQRVTRAWDFAASKPKSGTDPDWTVGVKIGRCSDGFFWILDVVRDRVGPEDVRKMVVNVAAADKVDVRIRGPQDPGQAGKAQAQDFARALAGYVVEFLPVSGSKEIRATPFAAQVNAGNVRMLEADWNEAFLQELGMFPSGAHDDQVDAATDAFNDVAAATNAQGWLDYYREEAEKVRAARGVR